MTELIKPCPFCGREAYIVKDLMSGQYKIRCRNISCTTRPKTEWYIDKKEAIRHWNNRATEAEIRAKAIDEFAEKLSTDVESFVAIVNGIEADLLTLDYFDEFIFDVAEQLKEE